MDWNTFPAITILVAVSILVAGCGTPTDQDGPKPSTGPTDESPLPTVTPTTSAPVPNPMARRANLTDCAGASVGISVPAALLRDDIPSNYSLWNGLGLGEEAGLTLEMTSCTKLALDGKDQGPAVISILSIWVNTPPDAETPDPYSYYVIDLHTDNANFTSWLSSFGPPVFLGTVEQSFTPLGPPPSRAQVVARVMNQTVAIYAFDGVASQEVHPREATERFYYGENPASDFWDSNTAWLGPGDGSGKLEIAAESRLAEVLEHSGSMPIAGFSSISDGSRTLLPKGA